MSDATPNPRLNPRRQSLLEIIVGDYIRTAAPVASQQIAREHGLSVSSATIRNDMAELEEMGYISRPHASAGGVPAPAAYRFYVGRMVDRARPSAQLAANAREGLVAEAADPDEWARRAAALLSEAVHNVAIATTPRVYQARIRQLQLVSLHERQCLLVLVMQEGRLRQRMVLLPQPATQDELTALASRLNGVASGLNGPELRTAWDQRDIAGAQGDAVLGEVLRLLAEEEQEEPGRRYTDGLRHMLGQPEFQSAVRAREAVEVLEDGTVLRQVFAGAGHDRSGVDVVIGDESTTEQLRPYSVVFARYGLPGQAVGVISALGPTRMDYPSAIASVRFLANALTGLLAGLEDEQS
jgi:heat-inducible transcriptional repressor